MLQDLSADRRAAWQLQNGASMQPSDLLDVASASCFLLLLVISLWLVHLVCFIFGKLLGPSVSVSVKKHFCLKTLIYSDPVLR